MPVLSTASPLEIIWTLIAVIGIALALVNLADAWADNAAIDEQTRDGLGDLAPSGRIIALDNVGREALLLASLMGLCALGMISLFSPQPAPSNAPATGRAIAFAAILIGVELCLVAKSVLGRLRRRAVQRLIAATSAARTEAKTATAALAAAVADPTTTAPDATVTQVLHVPGPPSPEIPAS